MGSAVLLMEKDCGRGRRGAGESETNTKTKEERRHHAPILSLSPFLEHQGLPQHRTWQLVESKGPDSLDLSPNFSLFPLCWPLEIFKPINQMGFLTPFGLVYLVRYSLVCSSRIRGSTMGVSSQKSVGGRDQRKRKRDTQTLELRERTETEATTHTYGPCISSSPPPSLYGV